MRGRNGEPGPRRVGQGVGRGGQPCARGRCATGGICDRAAIALVRPGGGPRFIETKRGKCGFGGRTGGLEAGINAAGPAEVPVVHLNGEQVEPVVDSGYTIITKDNAQEHIDKLNSYSGN